MDNEVVDLRRQVGSLNHNKGMLGKEVLDYEEKFNSLKSNYDKLWYEMFHNCKSEDIANVLIALVVVVLVRELFIL